MDTIKLKNTGGFRPIHTYADDVGLDLRVLEYKIIWPFCSVDLDLGLDVKIPDGFWGMIKSRSSTWKRRKLMVFEGVIDPGYTGKLSVLVFNPSPWPKLIKRKERLAQLIVLPACYPPIEWVRDMPLTMRGDNCFGSTGG